MMDVVWSKDFINLPPIIEKDKPIVYRVPWLEFIRAWWVLGHENNPFSQGKTIDDNDPLRNLKVGQNTETYSVRDSEDEEFRTVFLVTLNNAGGTAKIELFDEKYIEQSQRFVGET